MVRCVAFFVLGCTFVAALWTTVETHRLFEQPVMVATGTIH
jgi:hypothetical protein